MARLASGTVVFLFTDIEGSTLAPGDYVLAARALHFHTFAGTGEHTGVLGLRVNPVAGRGVESTSISCLR